MATQWITVAVLAGKSGAFAQERLRSWQTNPPDHSVVDQFCDSVLAHSAEPPVTYFCQWIDRWLMGDAVPGPNKVDGRKYQVTCLTRDQALAWADQCSGPIQEQQWLRIQLRQAHASWPAQKGGAVLIIREVIGPSLTDKEIESTLDEVPDWLSYWGQC